MRDEELQDVLRGYGIEESETTFIRHNENRTYKVDEVNGSSYLLRIHQPVKDSMAGLQHTYEGLQAELNMLEGLSSWNNLHVQKPLRNRDGELITIIQHEGKTWNSSVLTWLEGRDLQKDDVKDPAVVERLESGCQNCARITAFLIYQENAYFILYSPCTGRHILLVHMGSRRCF
ncbi:phosphotransferase enzyme family protein [Paenibacillus glucanolyticus]|uniref:phosphotransferase enzyme family protein n=1 Tax=Paenibacillus glucanolyticus TaxID=59843 RepID=UPI000B26BE97|nr:hypothetical protein [Paenibacillus glucanolyticus]